MSAPAKKPLARWLARRRELFRLWGEIQRVRVVCSQLVREMDQRRDGLPPDRIFDGAIDALLDLADELDERDSRQRREGGVRSRIRA